MKHKQHKFLLELGFKFIPDKKYLLTAEGYKLGTVDRNFYCEIYSDDKYTKDWSKKDILCFLIKTISKRQVDYEANEKLKQKIRHVFGII